MTAVRWSLIPTLFLSLIMALIGAVSPRIYANTAVTKVQPSATQADAVSIATSETPADQKTLFVDATTEATPETADVYQTVTGPDGTTVIYVNDAAAGSLGVIGGADGPTAIYVGQPAETPEP